MSLPKKIICIALVSLCSSISFTSEASYSPTFSSAEHVLVGENVKIYLSTNDQGKKGFTFNLPNGLNLTYGEIVSLGDFYELNHYPISQTNLDQEKNERFLASFNSFASDNNNVNEVKQILAVIHDEINLLNDGINKGEKPEDIYQKIGSDNDRKFNCITGGGCDPKTWFLYPGRYLQLINQDYDHFGINAWLSYQTGHKLALSQAVIAHNTKDINKLTYAYALDAFASHFLSDRFAAGHIRTPHQILVNSVTPGTVGSLLAIYMHNEENENSIHVHNQRGDHWIVYGDKSYFNPKNEKNRDLLNETMQLSATEIFNAYVTGSSKTDNKIQSLIPIPDEIGNNTKEDISPLFYWDDSSHKLMRRVDMTNLYDRHWTDNWWGFTTLVQLQRDRGLLSREQARLALSTIKDLALQNGLITNKEIENYIKAQKD